MDASAGIHRKSAIFAATILLTLMVGAPLTGQDEKDPHRPPCTNAQCRKARAFVKLHYCGESPAGNGPEDGCEIKKVKSPSAAVEVVADNTCEWNQTTGELVCKQQGQPAADARAVLMKELRKLGMPEGAKGKTYFKDWNSREGGWTLAEADYALRKGDDVEICSAIVVIEPNGQVIKLRKMPFQKTDEDEKDVTRWTAVDVADVEGAGQPDIILEGDEYENHWFEAVSVKGGIARTVFSGLGYYL